MATDSGTPLKLSDAAVMALRTLDPAAALDDLAAELMTGSTAATTS